MAKHSLLISPHTFGDLKEGSAERAGAWSGEKGRVAYRDAIRSRVCYVAAAVVAANGDVVSYSEADQGESSSAPRSGN